MLGFWSPAFLAGDATGFGDWQWFHHQWEAARIAIVRWGEAPLFDPHHCGGVPLWGNPQAQVYSPTWVLTGLAFGTTLGHKLYLLGHAIVGHAGMYALSRRRFGATPLGAFVAATVWACSGFFAWHGAGGHSTFISFYWAPWLFWAWRAGAEDVRFSAAVAALMALVVAEGGHYPFPYFVLWLGIDLLLGLVLEPERALGALRGAIVSAGLAALLCAYRIVPILLTVLAHPNEVPDADATTPAEILTMLTARGHPGVWPHRWVWNEYGGFVGWAVLALAAIGVVLMLQRAVRPGPRGLRLVREPVSLLVGLGVFFLLTQGSASAWHPWPWLQELPFYRSIHVPSRFRVLLTFYLAVLAGLAIDEIARRLARLEPPRSLASLQAALPWLLAVGLVVDLFIVNVGTNMRWDGAPLPRGLHEGPFRLIRDGTYRYFQDYASYPHQHVGTTECYDPIPWPRPSALWAESPHAPPSPTSFARVVPPEAGRVRAADRTSRTITAEIELEQPARLVFDQIHVPGFRSDVGRIVDHEGLLAVEIERVGSQRVRLRYEPADLPWVVGVSALGLILTFAVGFAPWRRRARVGRLREKSVEARQRAE